MLCYLGQVTIGPFFLVMIENESFENAASG
jgi:hypothetical protein